MSYTRQDGFNREIKVLVSRGGGQYLEFKKKANYTEKIVKEVVTFVNSERGQLLLGVDDEGMADCFNTAYSYVVFPLLVKVIQALVERLVIVLFIRGCGKRRC